MNLEILISLLLIAFVVVLVILLGLFLFLYHFVLFLLSNNRFSKDERKNDVGHFFRHYKFGKIRVFTISGATSPNRVWVNPQSKYHHEDQHYSNHYDRTYNDYGNSNYNSSQYTRYDSRDYDKYSNSSSHSNRGRQQYKENSVPQSASSFSFTKALNSAQSSNSLMSNSSAQPSLQDRVKPASNSSAGTSSFSFVKALQENKSNVRVGPSGDSNLYSKVEELTEDQKCQFESSEFTWGKIPLLPPSMELC